VYLRKETMTEPERHMWERCLERAEEVREVNEEKIRILTGILGRAVGQLDFGFEVERVYPVEYITGE
jgi:hypothetical protein